MWTNETSTGNYTQYNILNVTTATYDNLREQTNKTKSEYRLTVRDFLFALRSEQDHSKIYEKFGFIALYSLFSPLSIVKRLHNILVL